MQNNTRARFGIECGIQSNFNVGPRSFPQIQYYDFQLPRWILIWILVSGFIVSWDVMFVLFRPASLPGGWLAAYWLPYAKYIQIDKSYADLTNTFVKAQALMSLLEMTLELIAIFLSYLQKKLAAVLLAYSALLLTGNKTILIFLIEYLGRFANTGHNNWFDFVFLYCLPNAIWIVIPLYAVFSLGRSLHLKMPGN